MSDYDCIVIILLKKLEVVQAQALRLSSGADVMTPVSAPRV